MLSVSQRIREKGGKDFHLSLKCHWIFRDLPTHAAQAYGENFSPILRKLQLEGLSLLKAICEYAVDFLPNVSQSLDYSSLIPLRSDYRLLHFCVLWRSHKNTDVSLMVHEPSVTIPFFPSAILPGTPAFNYMVSLL